MDITSSLLNEMFSGFNTLFNKSVDATPVFWNKIAMDVKSTGSDEAYGWLTGVPQMWEWLGERHIKGVAAARYAIENRKFESAIRVRREDIEDDRLRIYSPQISMMAHGAASHPEELVFEVLRKGFTDSCYDGQPFFDADHPVALNGMDETSVSNFGGGSGTPWFLLDVSRVVKPIVFQTRIPYQMQTLNKDSDSNVFMQDEYLHGIRARVNAGYGLWQFAHGSKQTLDASNYSAARVAMQAMRYEGGRIMGVVPNLLVGSPSTGGGRTGALDGRRPSGWRHQRLARLCGIARFALSARVIAMTGFSQDVNTIPLPQIKAGTSDSWVQILPSGKFDLNDKRGPWTVTDMASVIDRSKADLERGMPVDMDHALDRQTKSDAPAAGWIEELAARDDGIWARIAWTPTGKAKIEGREYRFICLVVMVSQLGEVMAVKRAGLTNVPAIAMKAICSVEGDDVPENADDDDANKVIKMLREALGAGPDTSIAELIKKARAIIAAAGDTKTDNSAAKEMASSYMQMLSELHDNKVDAVLERARNSGKLVPAMDGWAQELASSNLAAFEA